MVYNSLSIRFVFEYYSMYRLHVSVHNEYYPKLKAGPVRDIRQWDMRYLDGCGRLVHVIKTLKYLS